jgi:hypothetical protein
MVFAVLVWDAGRGDGPLSICCRNPGKLRRSGGMRRQTDVKTMSATRTAWRWLAKLVTQWFHAHRRTS